MSNNGNTDFSVLADTPLIPVPRFTLTIPCEHGGGSEFSDLQPGLSTALPRVHVVDPADFLHACNLAGWADLIRVEEVQVAVVVVEGGFVATMRVEAEHAGGDDDHDRGGEDYDAHDDGW